VVVLANRRRTRWATERLRHAHFANAVMAALEG
jgi:hypothetical protein